MNCSSYKKLQRILVYKIAATFFFLSIHSLSAQIDEAEFFYRVNTIYYTLESSQLNNFSTWVTSNVFEQNTKNITQEELFPLEIIWTNPNRIFFIKRPLPTPQDSIQYKYIEDLQLEMLQELKGILLDWQRFYGGRLLAGLPVQYLIKVNQDSVFLEYEAIENSKRVKVVMSFNLQGICTQIVTTYYDSGQQVLVYPIFNALEGKWICTGWRVRIVEHGEITSGFDIKLNLQRFDRFWLPDQIHMELQTKAIENKRFVRTYKLRNIVINKNLQIMN